MTLRIIKDELPYFASLVPVAGRRVLDIGCGEGEFTRRLAMEAGARSVVGLEVEPEKRVTAMKATPLPGVAFEQGRAEAIPLPDSSVDVTVMLKSLHHVPIPAMDAAFAEIHRVLADDGVLYISEPVYAGELNEVMRLFHDEGVVRAAAIEATGRAKQGAAWEAIHEEVVETTLRFRDFDDFHDRMVVRAGMAIRDDLLPAVRERFGRSMTPEGARFNRQLRIDLLRRR